jgi:transposase
VLGNATQLRNVPGRKSDVSDAQWLADLTAHGLVRASFVPPARVQELRDLTRTRKQLVRGKAREVQRLQKVLEDCNIKLSSVVTDIMGKTGRAILTALSNGQTDPHQLAGLAQGSLKRKTKKLVAALHGKVTPHHQFMLRLHLGQVASLEMAIEEIEARVGEEISPFRDAWDRLKGIPGVSTTSASVIMAEIGPDMSRFPSAGHLVSWAGLCPRMDETAGKRRNTRLRKGAPWLKTVLVQCAWAAIRVKDTYLRAQYYRIKSRRDPMKAIIAVAASMLTGIYHMLKHDKPWIDLGADYFDHLNHERTVRRLCRRLQNLGYDVQLQAS